MVKTDFLLSVILSLLICCSSLLLFSYYQYVSVVNRDRKRKRFVRETGKEDQKKKKIKTDGGQVIANKQNKKNLYPFDELCLSLSVFLCCCIP